MLAMLLARFCWLAVSWQFRRSVPVRTGASASFYRARVVLAFKRSWYIRNGQAVDVGERLAFLNLDLNRRGSG